MIYTTVILLVKGVHKDLFVWGVRGRKRQEAILITLVGVAVGGAGIGVWRSNEPFQLPACAFMIFINV